MVDRSCRQIDDLFRRRGYLRVTGAIRKTHQRIGIGDVKIGPDKSHAERRVQSLQKNGSRFRDAITIGIAYECNPVGARNSRTRAFHDPFHDPASDALAVLRFGRGIGFCDKHVTVGKDVEPARVVETGCVRVYRKAGCRGRRDARRPTLGRSDMNGWNQRVIRRRKRRLRTDAGTLRQFRDFAATRQTQQQQNSGQ